jgi:cytochrome c
MKLLLAFAVLAAQAFSVQAADAVRGKQLYESRCGACHSIDDNRAGPAHKGVFGRKAGLAKGFDYSSALKASKVVWNEKTLDRWLANPEKLIPGQKMGFSVPDARDRADLVEFLRAYNARP